MEHLQARKRTGDSASSEDSNVSNGSFYQNTEIQAKPKHYVPSKSSEREPSISVETDTRNLSVMYESMVPPMKIPSSLYGLEDRPAARGKNFLLLQRV